MMKEYAVVPDDLLECTEELRDWFDRSYDWIGTLTPRATRRR